MAVTFRYDEVETKGHLTRGNDDTRGELQQGHHTATYFYNLNFGYYEDIFRDCLYDREVTYNSGKKVVHAYYWERILKLKDEEHSD